MKPEEIQSWRDMRATIQPIVNTLALHGNNPDGVLSAFVGNRTNILLEHLLAQNAETQKILVSTNNAIVTLLQVYQKIAEKMANDDEPWREEPEE